MNIRNKLTNISKTTLFKCLLCFSVIVSFFSIQSIESESIDRIGPFTLHKMDSKSHLIEKKLHRMGLKKTTRVFHSKASWYGEYFHGRTTANMEIFDKNLITAAHKTLPLNTYVLITNKLNNRQLIVRINDRGPYIEGRDIDLSEAAAKVLGSHKKGVVPITYQVLAKA
jgi:rare lipoprotein A (peptidoglycan hydrolase)